ncbi:MAG: ABC transporter substrate-binding protein, partial [Longimicrobiales bacterium]
MGIWLEHGRAVHQPALPPVEKRVVTYQPETTTSRRIRRCRRELCLLLIALAGCADTYADRSARPQNAVVDDLGRPVHSRAQVERIVSLIPSVTEILLELGVARRIVARTAYDTDARLSSLPSLGGARPGVEAVLQLRPDLVIVAPEDAPANLVARLDALGSTAYAADVRRTTDIYSTVLRLGTILGVPHRADSLVSALRAGLDEVRRTYDDCTRPTVFYAIWHAPPRTASRGTFIDEVISAAGGSNVFADLRAIWPLVSLEALVRR